MEKINLRDYYPFYDKDHFIDVSTEVAELLREMDRKEASYQRCVRRHRAYYSLDVDNGIHKSILLTMKTPEELCEEKRTKEALYEALKRIPEKQAKRIFSHYFLGMSKSEIAKTEHIHESTVRESIKHGLKNIAEILKKVL